VSPTFTSQTSWKAPPCSLKFLIRNINAYSCYDVTSQVITTNYPRVSPYYCFISSRRSLIFPSTFYRRDLLISRNMTSPRQLIWMREICIGTAVTSHMFIHMQHVNHYDSTLNISTISWTSQFLLTSLLLSLLILSSNPRFSDPRQTCYKFP